MKNAQTFNKLFNSVRGTLQYKVENAIVEFTEQVADRMGALRLSRTEFAGKLNTSPAYVTKFLSGGTNFTLESMIKVADALDSEIQIQMVPKDSTLLWIRVIGGSDDVQSRDYRLMTQWRRVCGADEFNRFIGPRVEDISKDSEIDQMFLTS